MDRRNALKSLGAVGLLAGTGAVQLGLVSAASARPVSAYKTNRYDTGLLSSVEPPDPEHISKRGRGWTVIPNGIDDTDNLEWALNNTLAGGTVRLLSGTYRLSHTIMVADFNGSLVGNGPRHTTITCTDELSYEIWEQPGGAKDQGQPKPPPFPRRSVNGSATRGAPGFMGFYKTPLQSWETPEDRANSIEIRNIRFRGNCLGTPWCFGDEVLCVSIINTFDWNNPEAAPATTRQDVLISNVEADGYKTAEFGFFENSCACISVVGGVVATTDYDLSGNSDGDAFGPVNGGFLAVVATEGDVVYESCTFRNCRVGPTVAGYRNGSVTWRNKTWDGCRGNCLSLVDIGNCAIDVIDNVLFCDSILLPPEVTGGATDVPSSLGCVIALQGVTAILGFPQNVRWLQLALDPAAHAAHPEAGPLGTWRPQGLAFAPMPSILNIWENSCRSSGTVNTYCFHVVDLINLVAEIPTIDAIVWDNDRKDSQTCISFEHVSGGRIVRNDCASRSFGIELYNSRCTLIERNRFEFEEAGCEVRILSLGEKLTSVAWSQRQVLVKYSSYSSTKLFAKT